MADKRIVDYIRNGTAQGYSINSLRRALLKQGWPEHEINDAVAIIHGAVPKQSSQAGAKQRPAVQPERSAGVLVIVILGFLGSALSLVSGTFTLLTGQFINSFDPSLFGNFTGNFSVDGQSVAMGAVGSLLSILGIISLVIGILGILAFYLLLKMKKKGLVLVIIIGIISLISTAISFTIFSIIPIVLWVVILGYLLMNRKLFV